MRQVIILSCLAVIFLASCATQDSECAFQVDVSSVQLDVKIEPLHKTLLNVEDKESLRNFLSNNPLIAQYFLQASQYPGEEEMVNTLFDRFSNPHIDTLQMEIDRVFGDLSDMEDELTQAFRHLKYYYPEFKVPKIQTVATGFIHDMYVSDSVIIIGLDFYLGPQAKYRPLGMFDYMLRRYAPAYVVPSIMLLEGISDEFNKTNVSDMTMLADMVAYGKAFYFAKHMMPCTPDSVLIWYSAEEMQGVEKNQDIIWAHFVEKELLFESNHMVKKKYIDARPKTYEIGEKAPGRIGTWLGWQIVEKYGEEQDKSLQELMKVESPTEIFNKSQFKPAKKTGL